MSSQPTITVVLANRPRLFRELLQHALNTASAQFRVVEATDLFPSTSGSRNALLRDADWLVVDDENATEASKLAASNAHLKILALDGRGSRARILTPASGSNEQEVGGEPTLAKLFDLLSKKVAVSEETRHPR